MVWPRVVSARAQMTQNNTSLHENTRFMKTHA
jgi:hypothetical protein